MFGDPGVHPTIRGGVRVFLDTAAQHDPSAVVLEHGVDVVPDVREGYLLGQWLSVGIRVPPGSGGGKGFVDVALLGGAPGVQVSGFGRVHAGQKRALPLKIAQTAPLPDSQEVLYLTLTTGNQKVDIQLPLRRSKAAASFTFASPEGADPPALVSRATLIPPSDSPDVTPDTTSVTDKEKELPPVLLALHGAGVDAAADFWIDAIPRIPRTWAILPTGRNEWAEDWHGGSAADVWAARNALPTVLAPLGLEVSAETVLIGHSNGGQGAWHAAARYPDRIRGVVAAAGWLTIQDYVPYTCL
jgi:hypothetical protein